MQLCKTLKSNFLSGVLPFAVVPATFTCLCTQPPFHPRAYGSGAANTDYTWPEVYRNRIIARWLVFCTHTVGRQSPHTLIGKQ